MTVAGLRMKVVRLFQSAEVLPFYILHFTFRPWKNLRRGVLSLTILLLAVSGFAAEQDDATARLVTPAADRSIGRGLDGWLGSQHEGSGSFGERQFRGNAAVTALAGMAMSAGGSTPGRGPYGASAPGGRLPAGQHPAERLHRRPATPATADVRPRLRHACFWPSVMACRRGPSSARSWPRPSS